MIFFKRKKIVIDAFTYKEAIKDYFPIQRATKFFPDWWRNLPNDFESMQYNIPVKYSTMKRCTGFIDLYKDSLIMPLWCDMSIRTYEDGTYNYVYSEQDPRNVVTHPRQEYGSAFDNFIHMKVETPWIFREKTGIQFYYGAATWNQVDLLPNMHIVPGLLEFKNQQSTHINMLFNRENKITELKFGQPMTQIIPLTENEFDVKCHLVSKQEFFESVSKSSYKMSFINKFRNGKRLNEQREKKCPFGFGR